MRQLQSIRPALLCSLLLVLLCLFALVGCGGGDGGNQPARTIISLSPNGPAAQNLTVTVGALSTGTPDSAGVVSVAPPLDATSTIIVKDKTTGVPVLMAVVPKGTAGRLATRALGRVAADTTVSPRTTILGLLFYFSFR